MNPLASIEGVHMLASLRCPKCNESWRPADQRAAASPVCPSCRRPVGNVSVRSTRVGPIPGHDAVASKPRTQSQRYGAFVLFLAPVAAAGFLLALSAAIGLSWWMLHKSIAP